MLFKKYKVSGKELFKMLLEIVEQVALPALLNKGFVKSPFKVDWYGKNDFGDFSYELCKLSNNSILERINIYVDKKGRGISIHLNVFKLSPIVNSLDSLKDTDGLNYHLPPNSYCRMQPYVDDFKGIPLFNYGFNFRDHKLKSFYTEKGYKKRVLQFRALIKDDYENIDKFFSRWHNLHEVNVVDWSGTPIKN